MAHAEPAVSLGHEDAGEAHLGHLLPKVVAEAVLAFPVAPVAQLFRDRAFLAHELLGGFGEHRLVFGVVQRHVFSSRHPSERWDLVVLGGRPDARDPSFRWDDDYAPGSSRIRLATTPSMTSLVPPS